MKGAGEDENVRVYELGFWAQLTRGSGHASQVLASSSLSKAALCRRPGFSHPQDPCNQNPPPLGFPGLPSDTASFTLSLSGDGSAAQHSAQPITFHVPGTQGPPCYFPIITELCL